MERGMNAHYGNPPAKEEREKKKFNVSICNGKHFLVIKLAFPQYSSPGSFKVFSEMFSAPLNYFVRRDHICAASRWGQKPQNVQFKF